MCVAIPARVISMNDLLAEEEVGGIRREVSWQLTPEAREGYYVLVHPGFAITIVDEIEAQGTLKLFAQLTKLNVEEGL